MLSDSERRERGYGPDEGGDEASDEPMLPEPERRERSGRAAA